MGKKDKLAVRTMPYTEAARDVADAWLEDSMVVDGIDRDDYEAVLDSLAEAFTNFARSPKRSERGGK